METTIICRQSKRTVVYQMAPLRPQHDMCILEEIAASSNV